MTNLASRFSKILEKIKILDKSVVFITIYNVLRFGQDDRNRDIGSSIETDLHTEFAFAGVLPVTRISRLDMTTESVSGYSLGTTPGYAGSPFGPAFGPTVTR